MDYRHLDSPSLYLHREKPPELLAPAGNLECFFAALESGADAIYLGLKNFSARRLASNFTFKELAQVKELASKRKVNVYVALNSLIYPQEIPELIDALAVLNSIRPDAIIIQDIALIYLVSRFFPELPIHASTLMAVHNHLGVRQLAAMGAKRVVLARELTLNEIRTICDTTDTELEVFVHGALCFSYSGLCLASSFLGGKSGLRGNCVQPCRRLYRAGRERGYFLSAGDLSAIEVIPHLKKLRLAAFKIEGRMKSSDYVAKVVSVYRMVLDASGEEEQLAVAEGRKLLKEATGRRPSAAYYSLKHTNSRGRDIIYSSEILAPHRSGTSGKWVGTVNKKLAGQITIKLRHAIRVGDRLRPESLSGKPASPEQMPRSQPLGVKTGNTMFGHGRGSISPVRKGFVINTIQMAGTSVREAKRGDIVQLSAPPGVEKGEKLFKVGSKRNNPWSSSSALRKKLPRTFKTVSPKSFHKSGIRREILFSLKDTNNHWNRMAEQVYLKLSNIQLLNDAFRIPVDRVLLLATKQNLEKIAQRRLGHKQLEHFAWCVPPIILGKNLQYYEKAIPWFVKRGFKHWWVNNWAHFQLFNGNNFRLFADSNLNISNNAAMWTARDAGCEGVVLSLEMTVSQVKALMANSPPLPSIMTVYGYPVLFTSRLNPPIKASQMSWEGDKRSQFRLFKHEGICRIYPNRPMNLFEKLRELRNAGLRIFIIDCSHPFCDKKELIRVMSGFKRQRADLPYTTFNFERT